MSTPEHPSPTRSEILRLIRLNGGMSAQQLAGVLHITPMGVRRHLVLLERDGLVLVESLRQPAGRPAYIYHLSDSGLDAFPQSYADLARDLLDAMFERGGQPAIQDILSVRTRHQVVLFEPRLRGLDLAARVYELAEFQREQGYMPVVEKTTEGYLLRQQNCAIQRVACRFQLACAEELELYRRLLKTDVTRVEHQFDGARACAYLVRDCARSTRAKK